MLTSRAPSGRKSGGGFPTRTSSVGYERVSETSATRTGCRRNHGEHRACRKAGVTEPFEQENEVPGAVDCGHVASTRRRIDKIKQSPVQIGEVGKSGTLGQVRRFSGTALRDFTPAGHRRPTRGKGDERFCQRPAKKPIGTRCHCLLAVSYTHLTLPTNREV